MTSLKDRFIVSNDFEKERLEQLVERILPFCKITESGKVILEKTDLKTRDKVRLVVIARYLASKLDKKISSEITSTEISDYLLMPKNQVNSRLKELKEKNILNKIRIGVYEADPTRIETFLKDLENDAME